jgi:hypothetical protein
MALEIQIDPQIWYGGCDKTCSGKETARFVTSTEKLVP